MSRARFIQYLLSSRSRLDIVGRRVEWCVRRPGAVDLAFLHDQHAVADGGAQPLIETCDKEVVTKVAEDRHLCEGLRTVDERDDLSLPRQLTEALDRQDRPFQWHIWVSCITRMRGVMAEA